MKTDIIALHIAMFFMLETNVAHLLHTDFNTGLLSLGAAWWQENTAEVIQLLQDKYHNEVAAKATLGFVKCYTSFFM